ncbi:MAG: NHLP leader peptide family RiPP precursor [Candidatus Muiribacteriota bacterium]
MSEWTPEEIQETINKVQSKAATDKGFRNKALNNPKEAVKELTGKDIPEDFKIKIIENEAGVDQTFVLPDFVGEELSDEQLDDVAGGRCRGQCNCAGGAKYSS